MRSIFNSLVPGMFLSFLLIGMSCRPALQSMQGGMIHKSTVFAGGTCHVNTDSLQHQPYLLIDEDNVEIDFNHLTIDGRSGGRMPDSYTGVAIQIKKCKNVVLKNVSIHGFKMAILAENVENLKILSSDVSYNYRPKLRSRWDHEALSDWLYYHHNENDEWKSYGAAVYLKHCIDPVVRDLRCHQGFNGLLMVQCRGGLICNNDISFNSGLGIGLYRSTSNKIMHNKLDWNARGYSHGQYARGQDSSAILLYEQSSHNTIAYNSGTHSGDGLFLWAGQSTMDSGIGGCDSNMIYKNDFSHSIANGIEVTFSANYMCGNSLMDCRYGVWGGYSHHSVIRDNVIDRCESGIAIEHGRYISLEGNTFTNTTTGIELWSRSHQPEDWPYAQRINVEGRGFYIARNHFENLNTSMAISLTDSVWTENNTWLIAPQAITSPKGAPLLLSGKPNDSWANAQLEFPSPLPDGQNAFLPKGALRGRKYIIINEWGPYDFGYPVLALRSSTPGAETDVLHFDILGPQGNWQIDSVKGCTMPLEQSGSVPDSMVIQCSNAESPRRIYCTFTGNQVISQFGDTIPSGTSIPFSYADASWPLKWNISFFPYDSLTDPLKNPAAFENLLLQPPASRLSGKPLSFRWWGAPVEGIPSDRFAITATSTFTASAGDYTLEVESDDGIRVWVDGQKMLDHWDIHTPEVDEVPFTIIQGKHEIRIEYFEGGGLGVLDVSVY